MHSSYQKRKKPQNIQLTRFKWVWRLQSETQNPNNAIDYWVIFNSNKYTISEAAPIQKNLNFGKSMVWRIDFIFKKSENDGF